eukprot:GFUD01080070.1.p1 GENE.GFUD01080070.1~~GFUD01080070.1.p1  ORF type:complete len:626 (+),score=105.07 GFUD01080070.1:130-1878(+)
MATSFLSLRRTIRNSNRNTDYGTKKYQYSKGSEKLLGLGVGAGFIGGAGYGYAASLVTYSIFHRYLYLQKMLHNNGYNSSWDEQYHTNYYDKNNCQEGCPPNSHCEWGICECDRKSSSTEVTPDNHQDPFKQCSQSLECSQIDINLVCLGGRIQKVCQCRKDMAWNSVLLECQLFLNAQCQVIDEHSPPSLLVTSAVEHAKKDEKEHYDKEVAKMKKKHRIYCKEITNNMTLQGHANCNKQRERCVKKDCLSKENAKLDDYIKELEEDMNVEDFEKGWAKDKESCEDEACKQRADWKLEAFTSRTKCRRQKIAKVKEKVSQYPGLCTSLMYVNSMQYVMATMVTTDCDGYDTQMLTTKAADWQKNVKQCMNSLCEFRAKVNLENFIYDQQDGRRELKRLCREPTSFHVEYYKDSADTAETANDRTESKNESLASSLLIHIKDTQPQEQDLVEAFCRDVDAFNQAFEVESVWRPSEYCASVPASVCAVVYDSHDCYSGWSMNITDGAQLSFKYFSSNWKYRNDIDTVGVREGCTFTGYSSSSFDGKSMSISAGHVEKWVVLGQEYQYKHMDEDIESLQCVCRG